MKLLALLSYDREPRAVEIEPGTQFAPDEKQADRVGSMICKRERAIAYLGPKHCLHNARPPGYKPPPIEETPIIRRLMSRARR